MVTSELRAEVKIWLFCAYAVHPAIITGTVRSLWTLAGATENAGLGKAAPDCRGGKRGSSTVWKAEVSVI